MWLCGGLLLFSLFSAVTVVILPSDLCFGEAVGHLSSVKCGSHFSIVVWILLAAS